MSYYPAIPVVEVEISQGRNAARVTLRAIVDSGADATIIPLHYLQTTGIQRR
jgi:hypothetical protein